MVVQRRSKIYLKKTQFYAPAPSLSFGKALYLLDDVPSLGVLYFYYSRSERTEMVNGKIRVPIVGYMCIRRILNGFKCALVRIIGVL